MKFNLEALKAYVGGIMGGGAGVAVGGFVVHGIEALVGNLPTSVETVMITAVAYIVSHIAVYVAPNATPSA